MVKSEIKRLREQSKLFDAGYQAAMRDTDNFLEEAEMAESLTGNHRQKFYLQQLRNDLYERMKK